MEKVKKLSMCRICLVENVGMYVVTNKSLQEMYEKLTDIPFLTEDSRPILVCNVCCTKLKQCCRLQRKCLEAEELLAQMLSEEYEQKPLKNQEHLKFMNRFIISPVENISIVEECQSECDAIKQEPAAVCEEQWDVELKLEPPSEELDPELVDISHTDVEDTPALHSTSESKDEQHLMMIKIEPAQEGEWSELEHRVSETEKLELEIPEKSYPDIEDIPAHYSYSDSEDVPLMKIKSELEEVLEASKETRRARVTKRAAVTKKPIFNSRKRELEFTIPAEQTMIELSNSTSTQTSKTRTSESVDNFKETITTMSQSRSDRSSRSNQLNQFHIGEKRYKCEVCQHSFGKSSHLKRHNLVHTGEKPFKCDVCQRCFSDKSTLRRHIRKHTGEKPFECGICQRSFSFSSDLRRHSQIHTREKPYKCEICQQSFRKNSTLEVHFRKHPGIKPFQCDVCQRSFSERNYLRKHNLIHTGEKPYKCDICQRSFSLKGNFVQHYRLHSGEKPFKCDTCQRSFSVKGNLKKHIQIHTHDKFNNHLNENLIFTMCMND